LSKFGILLYFVEEFYKLSSCQYQKRMLLVVDMYDPKGSAKSVHRDLNKLRVKLAFSKDSSLVKLPSSEVAFRQHILRVAFLEEFYKLSSCQYQKRMTLCRTQ
jgi:hypothetical protein